VTSNYNRVVTILPTEATIAKYKIVTEDIYNFDKTEFQIGVIATVKVIIQTKQPISIQPRSNYTKSGYPKVIQPGDQN
jgi:hypothetical protein